MNVFMTLKVIIGHDKKKYCSIFERRLWIDFGNRSFVIRKSIQIGLQGTLEHIRWFINF